MTYASIGTGIFAWIWYNVVIFVAWGGAGLVGYSSFEKYWRQFYWSVCLLGIMIYQQIVG
jgi:hypothetical protein